MSQRILLTGGAGFIGSHLAESLIRNHHDLTIVDNFDPFYPREWKEANLEEVRKSGPVSVAEIDIRDYEQLDSLFQLRQPEVVIHLAALAGVQPSVDRPLMYQQVNVGGTANILELCRKYGTRRLLFGSSSSVYGGTEKVPFQESQVELRPISPYAATKLSGELMCYTYAHLFDLECIALRFFTVFGPRQRPDLAIHKFFALLEAGKPLPFYGDGSSGRDYTFVADIVRGVLSAFEYDVRNAAGLKAPYDVFNLGNSHPVKLTELVKQIELVSGKRAQLDRKPMPRGDVQITWADTSKSKALLNFAPSMPFQEGLKVFYDWYRSVSHMRVGSAH